MCLGDGRGVGVLTTSREQRVALVFRGDRAARDSATVDVGRLAPVARALADVGVTAEAAVFSEDMADGVRDQLHEVDGALVWVDPVTGTADRAVLDSILREVAAAGVWVSAHPDVILKMGTKEVLYRTRELGWGADTDLYRTPAEFDERFPARLAAGGARVLKQHRGNGGIGVWKVELIDADTTPATMVRVQSARSRQTTTEDIGLAEFMAGCRKYFAYSGGDGRLIDQPFQPRITDGLIRCYLVGNRVVGFARQYPQGRTPDDLAIEAPPPANVFGLPSAKTMYGPDEPALQDLRHSVESDWVPAMQTLLEIDSPSLPALWDADFLYGPASDAGHDTYILSEINVSAVAPFPKQALPKLAAAVRAALDSTPRRSTAPR